MDIEADIPILIDRLSKTTGLILDVGTGRGAMAENLAKKGYHVVTVEYSEERIKETRQDFEGRGIENVLFIHADAQALPFLS